jgi:hypothetical protein
MKGMHWKLHYLMKGYFFTAQSGGGGFYYNWAFRNYSNFIQSSNIIARSLFCV